MKQLIFVFIGGGVGSVARFLVHKFLNTSSTSIPFGTLAVNVIGSLLIGLILGYASKSEAITQQHTLLLATGFCGGFTTFSTFAYENHTFLKSGDFTSVAIYTLSSLILGFLAVFAGLYLIK